MPQYLVVIYLPDNYDPSREDKEMVRDIDVLNEDMKAKGYQDLRWRPWQREVPAGAARGKVLITDGPYLETKEHIGGFWILEAADLDEALAWGRKGAVACRAPVEVRPIFSNPAGR